MKTALRYLLGLVAVAMGMVMALQMADEFRSPATLGFFLGLSAGVALAVAAVIQVQRLNPLDLSFISPVLDSENMRRRASSSMRAGGWGLVGASVGAFLVWVATTPANWSWQLFLAIGLGLLAGASFNDWLEGEDASPTR